MSTAEVSSTGTFSITHWECEGRVSDGEECHVMALPQGSGMTRPFLCAVTTHHTVQDTPGVCCLVSWKASSHCISFRPPEKMAMKMSSVGAAAYCTHSLPAHSLLRTAHTAVYCSGPPVITSWGPGRLQLSAGWTGSMLWHCWCGNRAKSTTCSYTFPLFQL